MEKERVYLRERKRANGTTALFLDFNRNGMRVQEFLKLYLIPGKSKEDKNKNKETMKMAEAIKAKRVMELQAIDLGINTQTYQDAFFFDVVQKLTDRKEGTTKVSWENCMSHLMRYERNKRITFKEITPQWVRGFRDYLDREATSWCIDERKRDVKSKPLAQGTKALMFQKLCSVFNTAVKEGIIQYNPAASVERFKAPESDREFLTIEEIKKLKQVPPPSEELGRAFFFSCLTGMRWSDIAKLKWKEVQEWGSGMRIVFKQQKTGGLEYLDLNSQAASMLGDRRKPNDKVFERLGPVQSARISVAAWVKSADIDKHITFHCARHTFAVMMINLGVDLYTVSKLLGHKDIKTTEIYAKILDKNKQDAVNRIPNIFGEEE